MELFDLWAEDEVLGGRKAEHDNLQKVHRAKVTDWLFAVGASSEVSRAIVHHALDIYNRYHQGLPVPPPKYQLQVQVCAALLIANKYNVRDHLSPGDLEYLACGDCSAEDIIKEEANILRALDFDLRFISPQTWIHFLLTSPNLQDQLASLSNIHLGRILFTIDLAVHCQEHLKYTCATLTAAGTQCVTGVDISSVCQGSCAAALEECTVWLSKYKAIVEEIAAPVPKEAFLQEPEDFHFNYASCLEHVLMLECPEAK